MKKMTIGRLRKMMNVVGSVKSKRWSMVRSVVTVIEDNQAIILSSKWGDSFRQEHLTTFPLDLYDMNTWSTYDNTCIDLEFSLHKNKIKCNAQIYEGNSFGGNRNELRFSALILLPNSFLKKIQKGIEWEFNEEAEIAYDKYLQDEKVKWMKDYKAELMGDNLIKIV